MSATPEVRYWRGPMGSIAKFQVDPSFVEVTVTPVVSQGAATPAGATWHTDPPPGWSTFGAHAFMDEVPALEFWGEEYGGDGLPIWERPVPAPDADVAERIAQEIEADLVWDDLGRLNSFGLGQEYAVRLIRQIAARITHSHATPPVAEWIDLIEHHLNIWRRYHKGLSLESSKEDWLELLEEDPNMIEDRNWGDAKGAPLTEVARFKAWLTTAPVDDEQAATKVVSGYTSHGHRIAGVVQTGRPTSVARCGGPGMCTVCSLEAGMATNERNER